MAKSVSCTECERLTEMIRQLQMKNETLQQIRENEQFIDSVAANIQGADGQTGVYGNTTNVEHTIADLADTIPWICPNTTGSAAEAPKLAFPNDPSYWHRTGARPKASTPARTWSDVTRRKGKSSRKSVKRAPTLTPPLELSLHNRPRLSKMQAIAPKPLLDPGPEKNYANSTPEKPRARRSIANTTPDQPDSILIGDSITKHVRMAKTENLTVSDTSVRELTELLPVILSTHPSNMRIIIHAGSFDILRGKTGSEILKKDFSLLLEKLSDCQSQNVFISGPIPTLGKGIESFTRLLALNTWLTSACFTHGIKFIDNFNIFWNCKDRFQRDGIHPNIIGCRLLGANLHHALGRPYQNKNGQIRAKDKYVRQTACISPPSPDPLLHITQGIQRMSLSQSGIQQPPSCPSPQPPRSQRHPPAPAQPLTSQRRPSPPPPQSPRSQRQPSPPPPRSPIKELANAATLTLKLKLSQTDELLNSSPRHHHSGACQR
ncbi:hypothetical protein ABVT39_022517 [Epinephelus coioides]